MTKNNNTINYKASEFLNYKYINNRFNIQLVTWIYLKKEIYGLGYSTYWKRRYHIHNAFCTKL